MVYSSTVKTFSVNSIKLVCGQINDTSNDQDLIDFKMDDQQNEENENNQENEEQELDGEDDFVKNIRSMFPCLNKERSYFIYLLKSGKINSKEHFSPPECIV